MRHAAARFALLLIGLAATGAGAACPTAARIEAFLADRAAARPAASPLDPGASLEDGICAQTLSIAALAPTLGPVVGWKAGLTSPAAQQAFGVNEPVLGALLRDMLLPDGATVAAAAAHRALFEADLIVEIADEGVNDARSPAEVLAHVRGVRPFLELPALAVDKAVTLDGPTITAINVGAWHGVMGDLVALPPGEAGVAMLASFTARLSEAGGAEISAAKGEVALGHPLNAVIWVAGALAGRGERLRAGDLVSVGSLGPLHPMRPGLAVRLRYEGLPGTPEIGARFE